MIKDMNKNLHGKMINPYFKAFFKLIDKIKKAHFRALFLCPISFRFELYIELGEFFKQLT
jgi:hypothetical protein